MLKIWDASNFRRTLGALCITAAPVLFAFGEMTGPSGDGPAALLTEYARNRGAALSYIYLGAAVSVLWIAASFALLTVLRRRGVVLGHVAAILVVLGVSLSGLMLNGASLMIWAMSSPGVDQHAMLTFLQQVQHEPAAAPMTFGHELMAIGIVLFGLAIWRSGFGYRWAGPLIALGVLLDVVAGTVGLEDTRTGDLVFSLISNAMLVAGLGSVGLRMVWLGDAEWGSAAAQETSPTRPVASAQG